MNRQKTLSLFLFLGSTAVQNVFAMASRSVDPNAPPPPAWVQFFPMIVMVGVFYFLLVRPQMRQRKERDQMLNDIKRGDRIVTQGGVYATIANINSDSYEVKINDDVKVKIRKSAVAEVLPSDPVITPEIVAAGK